MVKASETQRESSIPNTNIITPKKEITDGD